MTRKTPWKDAKDVMSPAQLKYLKELKVAAESGNLTKSRTEDGTIRLGIRSRGRPPLSVTKKQVTLRLSPEVIDFFKQGGRGWQTRIDTALRGFIGEE